MKRRLLLISVAIVMVVMSACTSTPTPLPPTQAPAPGAQPAATGEPAAKAPARSGPKVLRINIGNGAYPDSMDPQMASFVNEITVLQFLYEGLTRINEKGEAVAGAAEKWETSPDGKSMTFHLRAGLKRADGTPLTAKDFEYAFKRTVDPRVAGEYNTIIDDVVGAVEARQFDPKARPEEIQKVLDNVGVKATDERTLVVTFKAPVGYWPYIASLWVGWPSDPNKVAADPDNWWTRADGHNGNGPFKIEKIEENKVIVFVPNPHYHGGKPKIDRLEAYWITDSAVRFEAYRKGELDVIQLASEDLAAVEADPILMKEFLRGPAAWVTYMGMHQQKPPFDNKAVRMAFAQAFDRDTFVRDVLKGQGKTYLSWIPPGVPGYDETAVQKGYDPKAAVQTLIDAGFAAPGSTADKPKIDCKKLGEIKLTYSGTARNHARFQFIAGNFAAVFGCPVTLDPVDATVFSALVKDVATAPQIFLLGWAQDYPHPQNWLFIEICGGLHAGRIAYCNPEFDKALDAANQETDFAKAVEKYKAAQKSYLNDYAAAMLYYNENWVLVKPYVKGLVENSSSSDGGWPGQYGPVLTYDVDLSQVGPNYPTK